MSCNIDTSVNKEIIQIYKNILECDKRDKNYITKSNNQFKNYNISKSFDFIDPAILNFINDNKSIKYSFIKVIENNTFTINFYIFNKSKIPKNYIDYSFLIINFLMKYYTGDNKSYNIDIYLTHFKKQFNFETNIILPKNVNTGVTYHNNKEIKILIYRKEEWFKVLIHELIHALNLDFLKQYKEFYNLKSYFDISSDFNINESYVEFWARIINTCFLSYIQCNKSIEIFKIKFKYNLNIEISYSIGVGMKFFNLITYHNLDYKEKTNGLAYYLITMLLIVNYNNFMNWCSINNINLLKINSNSTNAEKFVNKIIEYSKLETLHNKITCFSDNSISLKMTKLDIFNY